MRRVAITGMGLRSPIGNTPDEAACALCDGVSGIREVPEWRSVTGLRAFIAGTVEGVNPKDIPRGHRRTMGRMAILGALAARDAVQDAGLEKADLASERAGVAMGSTTGSVPAIETLLSHYGPEGSVEAQEGTLFMKVMGHTVASNVAAFLGARGRLLAPCAACASSTQAIGQGYELIVHGAQDIMVCGGADDLHPSTVGVFDVLHAASKAYNDAPCRTPRPFDAARDGLVVAEGGAAVVLEDYEHARSRRANIHGEIIGYATSCAGVNMTTPERDGMLSCMREALDAARIAPRDLGYINAHATGTPVGDVQEAGAIRALVGDAVPVSATKGYTGHTLAACGAMELIFCLQMMEGGYLVPTKNLESVDPECEGLDHIREVRDAQPELVMTSNFAFGGVNATLVLKHG